MRGREGLRLAQISFVRVIPPHKFPHLCGAADHFAKVRPEFLRHSELLRAILVFWRVDSHAMDVEDVELGSGICAFQRTGKCRSLLRRGSGGGLTR